MGRITCVIRQTITASIPMGCCPFDENSAGTVLQVELEPAICVGKVVEMSATRIRDLLLMAALRKSPTKWKASYKIAVPWSTHYLFCTDVSTCQRYFRSFCKMRLAHNKLCNLCS